MIHKPRQRATDNLRRVPSSTIVARKPAAPESSGATTLQHRLGNQGVQRLMSKIAGRGSGAAQSGSPVIQAKLTMSHPGDRHEQEADRVADHVMRMPDSSVQETPAVSSAIPGVQRMCTTCDEELEKKSGPHVQRKEQTADAPAIPEAAAANIQTLQSGGQPLPAPTRAFFEPRFGANFSHVRLHTDGRAADTAKSINAKAFTVGRHIAFGPGQFAPESPDGQRLLAHELTHVVQQGGENEGRHVQRDDDNPTPQTTAAAPPPDPETVLIEDLATYLLSTPKVGASALEISKATLSQLKTTADNIKIDDKDLKQRLTAVDKKKRSKIVAAALARVQSVLADRRTAKVDELADEIVELTKERFVALAKIASDAELEEENELKADPKRKGKRRPQFGVIRKYILKDTIERQIDQPRVKPYPLRADYATPLGLTKDEVVFPELHDEAFVAELQTLPKSVRQRLKSEVSKRTILILPEYIQERMGTVPQAIVDEFNMLDKRVSGLIEGGLNGYFSVRNELLKLFGSPKDVPATIKAINDYFKNELVECDFLKASSVKMPGPGNTLVHKDLNEALMKAEAFMKDPKRQWLNEVVTSVQPLGYWATNIRENRNNPARPSEHTYGFALDINAELNRNLAKFKPADWDFISDIVGERVIYEEGSTEKNRKYTKSAEALRSPSDEAKMLEAMKKIRSQSATFSATFASDSTLRARLHQIVLASPAGKGKKPEEIDALIDIARQATTGSRKDQQQASKSLETTLEADFFKAQPIASEPVGTPSKLREKLVKLLAPNLGQLGKVTEAEAAIRGQIVTPVDKPGADAKKHKVGALFSKSVVKELNAVAAGDRAELARQVLRDLREPLVRKETNSKARALAGLLKRGFEVLDRTTDKTGAKVGPGEGMHNIAVHGFSNLNEKLVVALVHPDGGNLRWLGVDNQDMHHFELRKLPTIPKATISAPAPETTPATQPTPASETTPASPSPAAPQPDAPTPPG